MDMIKELILRRRCRKENKENNEIPKGCKKAVSGEAFLFLGGIGILFLFLGIHMGAIHMFNTLMNTAYQLLLDTVFYVMAIAVLSGAVSALFSEFGVISLLNKGLSPLMKPIYGLPGASAVGILTTYLSDNPAVLTLKADENFPEYFQKKHLPALVNLGTSFGMGMIVTTFMIGIASPSGESFLLPAVIGNAGGIAGSIVSTRLILFLSYKEYGRGKPQGKSLKPEAESAVLYRKVREGGVGARFMDALLAGGKSGVQMGISIIPGVLIICTLVLMLANGAPEGGYTGGAYEGVAILPWIGKKLDFILMPLFGFTSPEGITVPITALGAAGAAISLVPNLVNLGLASGHDVAVFTAMCICWGGFLSTHAAMMDTFGCRRMTGKAIACHTAGGLCAGILANWLYQLVSVLM